MISGAVSAGVTRPAHAQSGESATALQELVVTARRREENLQTTPVSITAISGDMLEQRKVITLADISNIAPNLRLYQTVGGIGSAGVYIRGIGHSENQVTQDSPVGFYLDGIASGRLSTAVMDLVEPERVEVLRGPQGTLFGRNTTAGAILVTSHTPSDTFGGMAKASYGTFKSSAFQARIDSGLLGGSGVKLTLAYQHRQRDGWLDAATRPGDLDPGAEKSDAYFLKAVGEWGDLSATFTADYTKLEGVPGSYQIVDATAAVRNFIALSPSYGGGGYTLTLPKQENLPNDAYGGVQRVWNDGVGLTLTYRISDALTIKSISGIRAFKRNDPTGYGPADLRGNVGTAAAPRIASFNGLYAIPERLQQGRQKTEELQALGSLGDFDYVAGFYYLKEKAWNYNRTRFVFPLGTGTTALESISFLYYRNLSKSTAGFAQLNWRPAMLDKKLEISGGVRRSSDTRTLIQFLPAARSSSIKNKDTSYLGSVSYQWTPDIMTYVRYSTGYRAGGFNARAAAGASDAFLLYQPEKIKAWEAGFKAEGWNHRIRLNGAVFHNKYRNLQIPRFTPPGGVLDPGGSSAVNADAKYKGFELELVVVPAEGLTVNAALGYVDPTYTRYPNSLQLGAVSPGCFPILSPTGVLIAQDCYATAHFAFNPKTTANAGVLYTAPATSYGRWSFRADYSYRSAINSGAFNQPSTPFLNAVHQKGYGLLSARIMLSDIPLTGDARAQIALYGDNLTDKNYFVQGTDFGFFAGDYYAAGRSIGIEGKVEF